MESPPLAGFNVSLPLLLLAIRLCLSEDTRAGALLTSAQEELRAGHIFLCLLKCKALSATLVCEGLSFPRVAV